MSQNHPPGVQFYKSTAGGCRAFFYCSATWTSRLFFVTCRVSFDTWCIGCLSRVSNSFQQHLYHPLGSLRNPTDDLDKDSTTHSAMPPLYTRQKILWTFSCINVCEHVYASSYCFSPMTLHVRRRLLHSQLSHHLPCDSPNLRHRLQVGLYGTRVLWYSSFRVRKF